MEKRSGNKIPQQFSYPDSGIGVPKQFQFLHASLCVERALQAGNSFPEWFSGPTMEQDSVGGPLMGLPWSKKEAQNDIYYITGDLSRKHLLRRSTLPIVFHGHRF